MSVNYKFKTEPFKHQYAALEAGATQESFALFMEMGTGKSKVLIDTIAALHDEIDFALIIAPKGVYRNWVTKEIPQHLSDDVKHRVIRWVSSPNKQQEREMKEVVNEFDGLTIFVMNVESFSTKKGQQAGTWFAKKFGHKGLIAIDESTTIKNPKAKRTKALTKIAHQFKYKRILTGSPVTKSPMDLYSQCEFLGPGTLGFDNFYAYQSRYAVVQKRQMGAHQFNQIVGFRHLEELSTKVDSFSYRVLKKDCLDLPAKSYTIRYVSLTDEQLKRYKELRDEAITLMDNGELVTAQNIMTQMLRLQQVLSGHLKTDDGAIEELPTKRIEAVMDILEETSGKVILWSRFRHDIQQMKAHIQDVYGVHSVCAYYGDTPDDERQEMVTKFQDPDSELRFFIGNPSTAGYGLTLTEATTVIYYANDFNLETRIQSEDRCHRIGQKNSVTYIDLITENTIDERIVKALRNKIDIGAKVLGEEAREWLQLNPKSTKA
jgi:SNF2 family DNA or RNA helicase